MSAVNVVGVVGAGQMGSGIAEVCARAGLSVKLFDVDSDVIDRGLGRIDQSLAARSAAAASPPGNGPGRSIGSPPPPTWTHSRMPGW
jgi:3-hydroxyacyl-CoA dehydrogenase